MVPRGRVGDCLPLSWRVGIAAQFGERLGTSFSWIHGHKAERNPPTIGPKQIMAIGRTYNAGYVAGSRGSRRSLSRWRWIGVSGQWSPIDCAAWAAFP